MVRIHTITNSSTAVTGATLLPVTALSYPHNGTLQEESRLAFTQLMTTPRTGGLYGYFAHVAKTDEYTTIQSASLPDRYRTAAERPLAAGNGMAASELSCALVESASSYEVAIQTLDSNYYNDNVVDNSVLIEVS